MIYCSLHGWPILHDWPSLHGWHSLHGFNSLFFAYDHFVSFAKITVSLRSETSEANLLFRFEAKFFRFLFFTLFRFEAKRAAPPIANTRGNQVPIIAQNFGLRLKSQNLTGNPSPPPFYSVLYTEPKFLNTLKWQLGWKCECKVSKLFCGYFQYKI